MDIQKMLEDRGLSASPESPSLTQGNLNKVYIVQDIEGRKYVLRHCKDEKRDDIKSYLDTLYDTMGLKKYGAIVRYRDVAEQVFTMDCLALKGIPVPAVRDHGTDWMLMDFVEGKPLKDVLPGLNGKQARQPIRAVLRAIMDAHKKGECLWDRWGANEMIDRKGNVCFIDYDLEVRWPEGIPHKTKASFDLAILLRGCIQFADDKKSAGRTVAAVLRHDKTFKSAYDLAALEEFLEGQTAFYSSRYCQNDLSGTADKEIHEKTNSEMTKIVARINRTSKPSGLPYIAKHTVIKP